MNMPPLPLLKLTEIDDTVALVETRLAENRAKAK